MSYTLTLQTNSIKTTLAPLLDDEKVATLETPDAKLHTVEVFPSQEEEVDRLSTIVESMQKEASARLELAKKLENSVIRERLQNCSRLLRVLADDLSDSEAMHSRSIYAAYTPQDMTIQGIATCCLSYTEAPSKIISLFTHPKNILPLDNEIGVQKVGTSLVKHVVSHTLEERAFVNKEVVLTPYASSKTFYEGVGFTKVKESSLLGYYWKDDMLLTKENGEALIKKFQDISLIDSHSPPLEKLA
jgi:hypothetical protein